MSVYLYIFDPRHQDTTWACERARERESGDRIYTLTHKNSGLGSEAVRVADNFPPSDTQSGGLFPHKSSAPFFLLRGRRLSDARTKMLSLDTRVAPRAEATRWRMSARAGRIQAHL